MTQSPAGGPAQTVYQVSSCPGVAGRAAQRVFVVNDGRSIEGGPQQAVYLVSESEIASGEFVIGGNKPIPIALTDRQGAIYPSLPVYVVTVDSPSDFPPTPDPTPPDPIGDGLRAAARAYWTLNEASGIRADATGRGNSVAPFGAGVSGAAGKVGNAASCGDGLWLTRASAADLQISGSRTIAFWLNTSSSAFQSVVTKFDYGGGNMEYVVAMDNRYPSFLVQKADNTGLVIATGPEMSLDAWHFIVATYDDVTHQIGISLDRGAFVTQNVGQAIRTSNVAFDIGGQSADSGNYTRGLVDEVGIFAGVLNDEQLDYLYNSGAGRALYA